MKPSILASVLLAGALAAQEAEPAATVQNQCVRCHREPATLRSQRLQMDRVFAHWYDSVHGRKQVGCESCHGGDPAQTDQKAAHVGVEPPSVETSRIYYRNLPKTCGTCHPKVAEQFQQSHHFANLVSDRLGPTCTTCHGFEMQIDSVKPAEIADRCTICHNQRMNIHPEVGEQLGKVVAALAGTKETLRLASTTVQLAKEEGLAVDKPAADLERAEERMRATGSLWHRFELESFQTELKQIKVMAEAARLVAREALLSR